jgi:DNA-binding CsgD family transcriptional regulator
MRMTSPLETLDLIAIRGLTVKETAEVRGVSVRTVYTHLDRLRRSGRHIPRVNAKPVYRASTFSLQNYD